MKVQQFDYLSAEAMTLRRRDGTPPWAPHICELDSLAAPDPGDTSAFAHSYREAAALRREIEGG